MRPRKLNLRMTLDDIEDEVVYTQAAVEADPDAADLAPLIDEWMPLVENIIAEDRKVRHKVAKATAKRHVNNERLDISCIAFGDDMFYAVGKDRKSPRWLRFFKESVSRFVKTSFVRQIATVAGWLSGPTDPVLDQHRDKLTLWNTRSQESLQESHTIAAERGYVWEQREELVDDLTRMRDAFHDTLTERARERGLPRTWADGFFRKTTHHDPTSNVAQDPAPQDPAAEADTAD